MRKGEGKKMSKDNGTKVKCKVEREKGRIGDRKKRKRGERTQMGKRRISLYTVLYLHTR